MKVKRQHVTNFSKNEKESFGSLFLLQFTADNTTQLDAFIAYNNSMQGMIAGQLK